MKVLKAERKEDHIHVVALIGNTERKYKFPLDAVSKDITDELVKAEVIAIDEAERAEASREKDEANKEADKTVSELLA